MKRNKRKTIKFKPSIFIGILLVLLIFTGIKVIISFRNASLKQFSRINFVLIDKNGGLAIFSLEKKQGQVYFLPAAEVTVNRGFGKYEWRKVFGLGELEKKGGQLVSETIQKNLSTAIFGYFYDKNKEIDYYRNSPMKLFRNVFWRGLMGEIKTNIGKTDLFLLYLRTLSLNRNIENDINSLFDHFDQKISQESLTLEVLNATAHDGLAQEVFNFLENSGGRVIRSADALNDQNNCEIKVGENFKESYTLLWIKRFFPCKVSLIQDGSRADITVVLGEDYWINQVDKW